MNRQERTHLYCCSTLGTLQQINLLLKGADYWEIGITLMNFVTADARLDSVRSALFSDSIKRAIPMPSAMYCFKIRIAEYSNKRMRAVG